LFLKHHFGVGYTLSFESTESFNVASVIQSAKEVPGEKPGFHEWQLSHGTESAFPEALAALSNAGATSVSLELTTLEEVFLETGKEDDDEPYDDEGDDDDADQNREDEPFDLENPEHKADYLAKIWEHRGNVKRLSFVSKFLLVQHFMMTNAWKIRGTIFLNIAMPVRSCAKCACMMHVTHSPKCSLVDVLGCRVGGGYCY
jgi:hypothetical protein